MTLLRRTSRCPENKRAYRECGPCASQNEPSSNRPGSLHRRGIIRVRYCFVMARLHIVQNYPREMNLIVHSGTMMSSTQSVCALGAFFSFLCFFCWFQAMGAASVSRKPCTKAPSAYPCARTNTTRSAGSVVVACALVFVCVPNCSAAGKARYLPRVDKGGLAFGLGWNSTPRAADLPLQKGRRTQASGQRKPSLANVHCQENNKQRTIPAMLNQVKSNMIGACKAIPTLKVAIASVALAAIWYMYPSLASAADVSLVAAGKLAAAASAPAIQLASFLPPGPLARSPPVPAAPS